MAVLQPPAWKRPRGYANGVSASGRLVFVAGQIGWNQHEQFESNRLSHQVEQALRNVVAVLAQDGARPEHICRMTWYVIDKHEYAEQLAEIGDAYRATIGAHYPAMTAVEVSALIEDRARVEIEVTAVVPECATSSARGAEP
jgi:enamine deaminase RidA (YjgF/YER057c/UK114 family)